ncbi:hypothetical protein L0F63_000439, partial [Massospora cicadina]
YQIKPRPQLIGLSFPTKLWTTKGLYKIASTIFRPPRSPVPTQANVAQVLELDESLPYQSQFSPMPHLARFKEASLSHEGLKAIHTFWFLQKIRQSIFTGAHLTSKLFIPPTLWRISHFIPHMMQKAQHLQWLTFHLDNMAECNLNHPAKVKMQLDLLDTVVQAVQSTQTK